MNIYHAVFRSHGSAPDRPALSCGASRYTYSDLRDATEVVAGGLEQRGVGPGDRVVLMAQHDVESLIIARLAAARLGAVASVVNPYLTAVELAPLLVDLEPSAVLVDFPAVATVQHAMGQSGAGGQLFRLGLAEDDWKQLLSGPTCSAASPTEDAVAEVAYTSGTSTGCANGVVLTHGAIVAGVRALATHMQLTPNDQSLCVVPLFHVSGMRACVLSSLCAGAHVILSPKFKTEAFWDHVEAHSVTYTVLVETILAYLMGQPTGSDPRSNPLRLVFANGRPDMLRRFEERFRLRCAEPYGSTEFSVAAATPVDVEIEAVRSARAAYADATYCGRPLAGYTIRVVDESGRVLQSGEVGQLEVCGPATMTEYLNQPDLSARRISTNGIRLGDLGRISEAGDVYFVGRGDDVIRRSGELVSPREVESAIERHPAVREALVFGIPDPVRGQEVMAIVVPEGPQAPWVADVWSWCENLLAPHKVPRYLEFRPSLPVGPTGKVSARAVTEEPLGRAGVHDRKARPKLGGC